MDNTSPTLSTLQKSFWHSGFLRILIANLLVSTSVYMFLPFFPELIALGRTEDCSLYGWVAVMYCVGLCLPAPLCNYWLDTYRRKKVVQWALVGLTLVMVLMSLELPLWGKLLLRLLQGSTYCVFQIALGSTLLLDLSDTKQRTEVAHIYYWFTRLALIFGPLLSLIVFCQYGETVLLSFSAVFPLLAWLLVSTLSVPFRAPLNPVLFSLDRFWLPRGIRIFIPMFLVTSYMGMFLAEAACGEFYILMAIGFFMALLVHQFMLSNNMQMEIFVGFFLFMLSGILHLFQMEMPGMIGKGIFFGMASGFVTSRFLLSYIRICSHCERGTAQTSYWIGWEAGLAVGFALFYGLREESQELIVVVSFVLLLLAFTTYLFGVRKWYVTHRRK